MHFTYLTPYRQRAKNVLNRFGHVVAKFMMNEKRTQRRTRTHTGASARTSTSYAGQIKLLQVVSEATFMAAGNNQDAIFFPLCVYGSEVEHSNIAFNNVHKTKWNVYNLISGHVCWHLHICLLFVDSGKRSKKTWKRQLVLVIEEKERKRWPNDIELMSDPKRSKRYFLRTTSCCRRMASIERSIMETLDSHY